MNRRTLAESALWHVRLDSSPGRGWVLLVALMMLLAVSSVLTVPVYASVAPSQAGVVVRTSEQYVFSMGIVDRVTATTLTLRFDDGTTETYTLDGTTTIQTQNGDALRLDDIEAGEMVIVLTVENDPLAVTIVSGGEAGFHEAGPADIRGHDERECVACDAHSPDASQNDGASR